MNLLKLNYKQDSIKKCKTGKPCGTICIPLKSKCRLEEYKIQPVGRPERFVSPVNNKPNNNNNYKAIIAGATILGVPVAAYMAARANYRAGIPKSAEMAREAAKNVEVPDIPDDKDNITFSTGGFYGQYGDAAARKGEDYLAYKLEKEVLDNNHFSVKHRNTEFNIPEDDLLPKLNWEEEIDLPTQLEAAKRAVGGHYAATLKPVFTQGRNPEAVKLASEVYAYHQKYPNKAINLVGHSAGGMVNHEAAEILDKMGVKVKTVNLGSSWYGFTQKVGESHTIATNKDFYLKSMGIPRDAIYVGSKEPVSMAEGFEAHTLKGYMRSPEVVAKLKELLNTKSNTKKDSINLVDITRDLTPEKQTFLHNLKILLSRVYTDGIDQFVRVEVNEGNNMTGVFSDENKFVEFNFDIEKDNVTYKLLKQLNSYFKQDSKVKISTTRNNKPRCKEGLACGAACVAKNKSCKVKLSKLVSKTELGYLKQAAKKFTQAAEEKTKKPDGLDTLTIRELKKAASDVGVYRYSDMTKAQLISSIRFIQENPGAQEERVRKTLEKQAAARDVLQGTEAAKLMKQWEKLQKIIKISGLDPNLGVAAIGAFITGVGVQSYNKIRDDYKDGLTDSAEAAMGRAEKMPTDYVRKRNMTFAVGGFSGDGNDGQRIKEEMDNIASQPMATHADKWFRDSNHVIAFQNKNFDIEEPTQSERNPDGSYNPAYFAEMTFKGFGAMIGNYQNKRNEDAVELAATIYAYANKRGGSNGNTKVHDDIPINVLAHGAGGMTAREAMEIISRMPNGKEVLKKVNLVALGTPDFGFTDKGMFRDMTISSAQDPLNMLPKRNAKQVNNVPGHSIQDYMRTPEVQEQLKRQFGYYTSSNYSQEVNKKRKKSKKKGASSKQQGAITAS